MAKIKTNMKTYKNSVRSVLIKYLTGEISTSYGVALLQETVKETWKPKLGEKYFCIYGDGCINNIIWDYDSIDNDRLKFGNVFKTRKEAEVKAEQVRKLLKNI